MLCFTSMSELLSSLLVFILILLSVAGSEREEKKTEKGQPFGISDISATWEEANIKRNVWAVKGSSVVLECNILRLVRKRLPTPSHNVTWYKNNVAIVASKRLVQTNLGHLNFTRVRRKGGINPETDDGQYHCVVFIRAQLPLNLAGLPIKFRVAEIARNVQVSTSNTSVHEGESLRLLCQIASQPAASIAWQRSPTPLPQDGRLGLLSSGVLQITNVQKSDSGIYKCMARNDMLNKTKDDTIQVTVLNKPTMYFPPTFLSPESPTTQQVIFHEDALLECLATGFPLPTILWEKKVSEDSYVALTELSGKIEFAGWNLRVRSVGKLDAGKYRCKAHSVDPETGEDFSNTQETTLQVVLPPAPIMVQPMRNFTKLIGQTSRLNCSLQGHNLHFAPSLVWYKDGRLMELDSRMEMKDPTQIIITNSLASHTGVYQCLAENQAGFSTSWTYMLVNSSDHRPGIPTNLRYVVDSPTSVQLHWDPVVTPSVQAYTIHYIERIRDQVDPKEKLAVSSKNSYHLDGLKPNTNYVFAVRSYSDVPSELSTEKAFRTMEDVPSVMPEFRLKALSPTTMKVTWSPLTLMQALGKVIGYKIQWRRRSRTDSYNLEEVAANTYNHNIKALHPGKIYKVQVLAGTAAGYPRTDQMAWQTISMPELVPMAPKLRLKATIDRTNDQLTSIKIAWVQSEEDVSPVEGYLLKYKRQDQDWSDEIEFPHSTEAYIITGLEPHRYQIEIRAFNQEGDSATTTEAVDTSDISEDDAIQPEQLDITNLEVYVESATVAHLSWTLKEPLENFVKFYMIKQVNTENYQAKDNIEAVSYSKSTTNSITIDSLMPYSNYEFNVRAHISDTNFGQYSTGVPLHATTLAPSPPAPVIPEVRASDPIDPSTIKLEWSFLDTHPSKFLIAYSENASVPVEQWKTQEFPGDINQGRISGLISNKIYWFKISACSEESCGEYSSHMTGVIPAVLSSNSVLWLIVVLLLLMVAACIAFCFIRYMSTPTPHAHAHALNCNGNGSIVSAHKHTDASKMNSVRQNGTDSNGTDYIPMLNRIHSDTPATQLDTKGGYPTRVNGFTNPRLNGLIKPKDHFSSAFASKKTEDIDECERLFPLTVKNHDALEDEPSSNYLIQPRTKHEPPWSQSAKNPLLHNTSLAAPSVVP